MDKTAQRYMEYRIHLHECSQCRRAGGPVAKFLELCPRGRAVLDAWSQLELARYKEGEAS